VFHDSLTEAARQYHHLSCGFQRKAARYSDLIAASVPI
jgi:hypothetical protein